MTKRPRQPRKPLALKARCLTIADAAVYCGLTPGSFRDGVAQAPTALPGTHRWDRKTIDFPLDRLSGIWRSCASGATRPASRRDRHSGRCRDQGGFDTLAKARLRHA